MRSRSSLVLLLPTLVAAVGCPNTKALETAADRLLSSFATGDYNTFSRLVDDDLRAQYSKKRFDETAAILANFGAFQGSTAPRVARQAVGPKEGIFGLTYEKGKIDLRLTTRSGVITAFGFEGPAFEAALQNKASGALRVTDLRFIERPFGKPRTNAIYTVGDSVFSSLRISNLTEKDRNFHFKMDVVVFDADGQKVYEDNIVDIEDKFPQGAPAEAKPWSRISAKQPGKFRYKVTITDVYGGQSLEAELPFTVVAKKN